VALIAHFRAPNPASSDVARFALIPPEQADALCNFLTRCTKVEVAQGLLGVDYAQLRATGTTLAEELKRERQGRTKQIPRRDGRERR